MALVPYLMVIVIFGIAAIPAVKDFLVGLDGSKEVDKEGAGGS